MVLIAEPPARDVVRDLALAQNGLLTRQQALDDLGLTKGAIDNLVGRGRLERVAHGIYRVPYLPGVEDEMYQVAILRTGDPAAALSHETALALYEICDVNPGRYHVTVPVDRRIRRADNPLFAVHVQQLSENQLGWWHEMRIVTPATAIDQCLGYGTPTYLLRQALERGTRDGILLRDDAERLTTKLET